MYTLVVLEVCGLAKALSAGLAAVRTLPRVDAHVCAKPPSIGQLLPADATAIGLLPRVHTLVYCQGALEREGLVAVAAPVLVGLLKSLLPRMYAHMFPEQTGEAETLGADLAGEGTSWHVDVGVPSQVGWVDEALAAHITAEWLGSRVAQQVRLERVRCGEPFGANAAPIQLLSSVGDLVALQVPCKAEEPATVITGKGLLARMDQTVLFQAVGMTETSAASVTHVAACAFVTPLMVLQVALTAE